MDASTLLVGLLVGTIVGLLGGALWSQHRASVERDARRGDHEARVGALETDRDAARVALAAAHADTRAKNHELETLKSAEVERRAREDDLRSEQKSQEDRRRAEELAALKGEFARLSQEALRFNSEQFLQQAGETLEARRQAVDALLKPFKEQLDKLATGTQQLEMRREGAYAELKQQLVALQQATDAVNVNSRTLIAALRGDARARGRWGELALRNVAEMAGMTEHCDFEVQVVLKDGSRPDMVVRLPGGDGRIPIDAKAPMDAYMRAVEAVDLDARATGMVAHAEALRKHVRTLAGRDYAGALGAQVDFTVMFVPGEPILAAAFEADPAVQTEAMERRILIATPVTLIALLRTVGVYWRQSDLADNAQQITEVARNFHERVRVFTGHLAGLGKAVESAVARWNEAVGSYEARVVPQGRELERLQAPAAEKRLPDLPRVDSAARVLTASGDSPERATNEPDPV